MKSAIFNTPTPERSGIPEGEARTLWPGTGKHNGKLAYIFITG